MKHTNVTRRVFTMGALSGIGLTAACGNGIGNSNAAELDVRVDSTLAQMYQLYPNTKELADKASGMLVMPIVTEAGFGFGGAYGQGALRIQGATVDYYSLTEGSWGLQIGAQQYS
ncbi:MAG: twin-arginine translocation pathway signal, partial [Roseobacter sp.]